MVRHECDVDCRVESRNGAVHAREPPPENGKQVEHLKRQVRVNGAVEEAVVLRPDVQQRHEPADHKVLEREGDLATRDRAHPGRNLAPETPNVHEFGAIGEGEPRLPQHIVVMAPRKLWPRVPPPRAVRRRLPARARHGRLGSAGCAVPLRTRAAHRTGATAQAGLAMAACSGAQPC
eukprot:scaffold72949_cov35-Tisochrysis_lutea.AAC.4